MIRRLAILATLALLPALPVSAFHMGETFQVRLRTASVHGSYSKQACSIQANILSEKRQKVSFAIYWQIGRGLWLLTTHAGYAQASGPQEIEFIFPSGKGLRFPMTTRGKQVQVNIGYSSNAEALNHHIAASNQMQINLLGVNDRVTVDLSEQADIVAAMKKCSEFLH